MGQFFGRGHKGAVQHLRPLELALSFAALTGRHYDTKLEAAQRLGLNVLRLELFAFATVAVAHNAVRHPLMIALTPSQRRAVMDASSVFSFCLWTDGREGLAQRLPAVLDGPHYTAFKRAVDWRQYWSFADLVRERGAEYGPFLHTAAPDSGPLGVDLGNAIARRVLGHGNRPGPMEMLWCAGLFQDVSTTTAAALNSYRYRPDPRADAAAAPDEPDTDLILACRACGQKNRIRAGRPRGEAICGRCRAPL